MRGMRGGDRAFRAVRQQAGVREVQDAHLQFWSQVSQFMLSARGIMSVRLAGGRGGNGGYVGWRGWRSRWVLRNVGIRKDIECMRGAVYPLLTYSTCSDIRRHRRPPPRARSQLRARTRAQTNTASRPFFFPPGAFKIHCVAHGRQPPRRSAQVALERGLSSGTQESI